MKKIVISPMAKTRLGEYVRPFLGKLQFGQTAGPSVRGCFRFTPDEAAQAVAELGDKRTTDLPFIDASSLTAEEIFTELSRLLPDKEDLPPISAMVKSFTEGIYAWARSGFTKASPGQIEERLSICRSCEWWNPEGFRGTGRCRKCGCSTWAKIRMTSSACPIGKWLQIPVEAEENTVKL